ncbi:MAG: hypothetical protein EH224_10120 [Calditrichaeota bacterium]|nr:MAG: hypothetical protein EH224_10120 [Calditrichota bacterium]
MRKLKFKEISMLTKIIKQLGIKEYKKELMSNLNFEKIEKLQIEALKEKDAENKNILQQQMAIEAQSLKKDLAIDIFIYVIEKYDEVEEQLFVFFASYSGLSIEDVKEKEIDWIYNTAKELWQNTLPKTVKTLIEKHVDLKEVEKEVKKKLEEN